MIAVAPLLQGVPPPTGEAWPWAAGVFAIFAGYLGIRVLGDKDKQIDRCLKEVEVLRTLATQRADKMEAELADMRRERRG